MEKYVLLDINFFGIIVLSFLAMKYRYSYRFGTLSEKFFMTLVLSNIVLLVTDILSVILKGIDHPVYRGMAYISKTLFFASCMLLCMSWLYFYITRIHRLNRLNSKFLKYILPLPFVFFNVFMIMTLKSGAIFSFTQTNTYVRGQYFHVTTICGFFYIIAALIFILINRKKLTKGEYLPLVMTPLIAIFLGVLQSLILFPTLFVWPLLSIVFNGIHMSVLDTMVLTDHLTGLNNRMALDKYLRRICSEHFTNKQSIGFIMIDVDDFKKINDTSGHIIGDEVLKECSNILRKSFNGSNFMARYGGDEFSIVVSNCSETDIWKLLDDISEEVDRYNQHSHTNKISFSTGYKVIQEDDLLDVSQIIHDVDRLMYLEKQAKKS